MAGWLEAELKSFHGLEYALTTDGPLLIHDFPISQDASEFVPAVNYRGAWHGVEPKNVLPHHNGNIVSTQNPLLAPPMVTQPPSAIPAQPPPTDATRKQTQPAEPAPLTSPRLHSTNPTQSTTSTPPGAPVVPRIVHSNIAASSSNTSTAPVAALTLQNAAAPRSQEPRKQNIHHNRVIVGNLHPDTSPLTVFHHMKRIGHIHFIEVLRNSRGLKNVRRRVFAYCLLVATR